MSDDKDKARADRACLDYLSEHRDFFMRHPDLLERMELPHGTETVPSLLSKRMELMSKENDRLRSETLGFMKTAEINEQLSLRIYRTGCDFIRLALRGEVTPRICCDAIRRHFTDFHVNILVFGDEPTDAANQKVKSGDQRIAGIVRYVFDERQLSCGPFSAAERTTLFGDGAARYRSVLVAGLGGHGKHAPYGLLVLASTREGRFAPGLGTMFLVQLNELTETVLGVDGGA